MAIKVTERTADYATAYCTRCEAEIREQWRFYAETIGQWRRELAANHECED